MIIGQGMLCIQMGGETIPVAPCQIHNRGEITTSKLHDRESNKKTINFFTIGKLSPEKTAELHALAASNDEGTPA